MPRMTAGKRSELGSFGRAHLDGWRRSDLNQREYCALHGLPLKRFRWKQERAPAAKTETTFLPVTLTEAPEQSPEASQSLPGPAPVIVERSAPGIEVELIGGRRVRFERDADPETVRRLVSLLEGEAR